MMYITVPDWSGVDDDAVDAPLREVLNFDFDCQAHFNDWLNAVDIPDWNLAYAKITHYPGLKSQGSFVFRKVLS